MKKFKVTINGNESVVTKSSVNAALKTVLPPLASQHRNLRSGETVTLSVTIERLPFTKDDIAAREKETEEVRERASIDNDPARIEERLSEPRYGDILADQDGIIVGYFTSLAEDGNYRMCGREDYQPPIDAQIQNISAQQRVAEFRRAQERIDARNELADALAALGL